MCRGYQRAMVKSMSLAAKIPHFHYVEEISCDALVELRASFQKENSDPDIKHTFLPVLIKSLSMALNKYPWINSSINDELNEVTLKGWLILVLFSNCSKCLFCEVRDACLSSFLHSDIYHNVILCCKDLTILELPWLLQMV